MRILCIIDCYYPVIKSSAGLMHDLAVQFGSMGHQVTVATQDDSLDVPCRTTDIDCQEALKVYQG